MNRLSFLLLWLIWTFFTTAATPQEPGGERSPAVDSQDLTVQRDLDTEVTRVRIPSADGRIRWSQVLQVLLRLGRLDDQAIANRLPQGELDLRRPATALALLGINATLAPEIQLSVVRRSEEFGEHLLITIDEGAMIARRRAMAKKARELLRENHAEGEDSPFGFHFPPAWKNAPADQLLVVIVHGIHSSPQRFQPLADALAAEGFLAAPYSYPDDQPIEESAEQLAGELKALAIDAPRRPIAVIAHSMGGLVTRAVIENPRLDPGNVRHLVMIATPNHGSLLAKFAFGLDILDHAIPDARRPEITRFYASVEDGFSEAAIDLHPDSKFLRRLNARSRNPHVHYSLFLGTGGFFSRSQLDELQTWWHETKANSPVVSLLSPRVDETINDLDEVVHGDGDGVVAVKRGKLEGVQDVVVADFSHLEVLQQSAHLERDPLLKMILERLRK